MPVEGRAVEKEPATGVGRPAKARARGWVGVRSDDGARGHGEAIVVEGGEEEEEEEEEEVTSDSEGIAVFGNWKVEDDVV